MTVFLFIFLGIQYITLRKKKVMDQGKLNNIDPEWNNSLVCSCNKKSKLYNFCNNGDYFVKNYCKICQQTVRIMIYCDFHECKSIKLGSTEKKSISKMQDEKT